MFFKRIFLLILLFVNGTHLLWAKSSSLEGLWETIDDRTGNKKAIVKIYKKNNAYFANIVKVYWKKGDQKTCVHCKAPMQKNKPIEGLTLLWNLKPHSRQLWDGGEILDPHNGQVYQVRMKKNGDMLYVRAFLGVPILGRTQEWHRYSR